MNYYIHVPFCRKKCGYCAFYSEENASPELIRRYLDKLEKDLRNFPVSENAATLFIGGGTPTLLNAPELRKLLTMAVEILHCSGDTEITIEANPETLDCEKIKILTDFVNRISVGVQSFSPENRRILGRNCSQEKLLEVLDMLGNSGIKHFNCDMIYGIPGQKTADWEKDLHRLLEFNVDHVSCYSLTPEEGSALGGTFVIDDNCADEMYDIAEKVLARYGIFRYEISNYAVPGGECRHNCNVWRGGRLAGFGPAASGFDGRDRMSYCADIHRWLDGCEAEKDVISPEARLEEIFAVNLRTVKGWDQDSWSKVKGSGNWNGRIEKMLRIGKMFPGCVIIENNRIYLSGRGLRFWDNIAGEILI